MPSHQTPWLAACVLLAACSGSGGQKTTPTPPVERAPAVTEAGRPMGPVQKKTIDATGGTLAAEDGRLTVTVPAGAVGRATEFSIQPVTSPAPGAIGMSYHLEPHDVTFAAPVTLAFHVPEAGVSRTSLAALHIALREDSGQWRWLADPVRDEATKTIAATTTHFCDAAVVEGVQLRPVMQNVVEGSNLDLFVVSCEPDESHPLLQGLVLVCKSIDLPNVGDWAVNTVPGGNSTWGTIRGSSRNGLYTAPTTRPTPSVVRAQAHVGPSGKRGEAWVFSELMIGKPPDMHGKLDVTSTGVYQYTAHGQDVFITPHYMSNGQLDDGPDMTRFEITGNLVVDDGIQIAGAPCTAKTNVDTLSNNTGNLRKDPTEFYWNLDASWAVTCSVEGKTIDAVLPLVWNTGCTGFDYYPLITPNHIQGTSTRGPGCFGAVGTLTVTWDWVQ